MRLLATASKVGLPLLGLSCFIFLGALFYCYPPTAVNAIHLFGLHLALATLVAYWLRTRPRKIPYDAVSLPIRAKAKGRIVRVLVWMPSIIAAFVLFFLPVASHLFHPSHHFLRHYSVPIPWTAGMIISSDGIYGGVTAVVASKGLGGFGVTPFRDQEQPMSAMTINTTPANNDRRFALPEALQSRSVAFTCARHSINTRHPGWLVGQFNYGSDFWQVSCVSTIFQPSTRSSKASAANDLRLRSTPAHGP